MSQISFYKKTNFDIPLHIYIYIYLYIFLRVGKNAIFWPVVSEMVNR